MKTIRTLLAAGVLVMCWSVPVSGQEGTEPPQGWGRRGMGPERIERYKKMRLIEVLDLKEEDAARFVAKHKTHETAVRDLMKQKMNIVDELEKAVQENKPDKDFELLYTRMEENDQKIFEERKRFHRDLKGMLSAEQMAKFFVFDRNFNRELREAMEDMRRERRRR